MEERPSPKDADEGVRVPQGKGDGEADIANGEDGQGIGHRPECSGQDRPQNQMRALAQVAQNGLGAFHGDRQSPSGEKNAQHHAEGDGEGREARRDQAGRSFGGPQPCAGGKRAQDAEPKPHLRK